MSSAEIIQELQDWEVSKKLIQLKQSADSRNIEFNLSFRRLKHLMKTKKCYFTKIQFEKGDLETKFSIDRIDNNIGYIDQNVVACSVKMNGKKGDLSFKEIEILYRGMKRFNERKKKIKKKK